MNQTTNIPVLSKVLFYSDTMLSKPVIILFSGKAGTGKSTAAYFLSNLLARKGFQSERSRFADGVKECAINFFNWNKEKDDRGRRLLQGIGNIGREYDPDTWVNMIFEKFFVNAIFPPDIIIIDDWRFPNEAEFFINNCDCVVIKIKVKAENRESLKNTEFYDDISEVSLDAYEDYDFVIDNSGTENDLYDQLEFFIKKFFNRENKN